MTGEQLFGGIVLLVAQTLLMTIACALIDVIRCALRTERVTSGWMVVLASWLWPVTFLVALLLSPLLFYRNGPKR